MRIGDVVRNSRLTAINAMPTKFKGIFDALPPELLEMTEVELEAQFNRTSVDFQLRQRLWELVAQSEIESRKLTVDEWARGICDPAYIHQKILHSHFRLVWLFTPLLTGFDRYSEFFDIIMTKLRKDILDMKINDENRPAVIKLLENITNRTMGPVPKHISLKTQTIPAPPAPPVEAKDVDARIQELEQQKLILEARPVGPESPE